MLFWLGPESAVSIVNRHLISRATILFSILSFGNYNNSKNVAKSKCASLMMCDNVERFIGLCAGTITCQKLVAVRFRNLMWLPFCETTIQPSRCKARKT